MNTVVNKQLKECFTSMYLYIYLYIHLQNSLLLLLINIFVRVSSTYISYKVVRFTKFIYIYVRNGVKFAPIYMYLNDFLLLNLTRSVLSASTPAQLAIILPKVTHLVEVSILK